MGGQLTDEIRQQSTGHILVVLEWALGNQCETRCWDSPFNNHPRFNPHDLRHLVSIMIMDRHLIIPHFKDPRCYVQGLQGIQTLFNDQAHGYPVSSEEVETWVTSWLCFLEQIETSFNIETSMARTRICATLRCYVGGRCQC